MSCVISSALGPATTSTFPPIAAGFVFSAERLRCWPSWRWPDGPAVDRRQMMSAVAPYSHVVEKDGWLFVTGQLATDPDDDGLPPLRGLRRRRTKSWTTCGAR